MLIAAMGCLLVPLLWREQTLRQNEEREHRENEHLAHRLQGWTESAIAFFDFLQRVLALLPPRTMPCA